MSSQTPKLGLNKPVKGDTDWAAEINANWTVLDDAVAVGGTPASGDIIYRGSAAWQRLAKGADQEVLKLASGAPAWAAETTWPIAGVGSPSGGYVTRDGTNLKYAIDRFHKVFLYESGKWVDHTIPDAGVTIPCTNVGGSNWLSGWSKRKKLSIDHTKVSSALTDFPVFVRLSGDSDVGASARSDGHDIRFTSSDGATLLKHERESFSVAGGAATGHFWVKLPSVSSTADTEFYMYYGKSDAGDGQDPTNVWDSNFKGVWHLSEASGTLYDSTGNDIDSTGVAGAQYAQTGKIHKGMTFDGSGGRADFGDELAMSGSRTLSAWVYWTASGSGTDWDCIVARRTSGGGSPGWSYMLQIHHKEGGTLDDKHLHLYMNGFTPNNVESSIAVPENQWCHVVGVYDAANHTLKVYIDGTERGSESVTGSISDGGATFSIGDDTSGDYFGGTIDEVEVSDCVRSVAWISAAYTNQNDPASFYTLSGEEDVSGGDTDYYLYIYDSAGTLTLELTTTVPTTQNGIPVKTGATDRLLLARCRTDSSNEIKNTETQRFLNNAYNKRPLLLKSYNSASNWTYNSSTWRECNGGTNQTRAEFVADGAHGIFITGGGRMAVLNAMGLVAVGYGSTSSPSGLQGTLEEGSDSAAISATVFFQAHLTPTAGYHYFTILESAASGTMTLYGTANGYGVCAFGRILA